jgi:hypothetical protein
MRTIFCLIILEIIVASAPLTMAKADNASTPALDVVAPEISAVRVPDKVYAGSALKIEAQVSDNQGLKSVAVFFRRKGAKPYTRQKMTHTPGTDNYFLIIKNVPAPGVEYYLEAADSTGNLVRNGQEFSPRNVNVLSELDSSIIQSMKPGRLNNHDILTLFRNNTVDGRHLRKYFTFTRYFAADGRLIGRNERKGIRIGRWRVTKNTLCEKFNNKESCREIVKEGSTIKKYTTTRSGDRVVAIIYKRFRFGNPENL